MALSKKKVVQAPSKPVARRQYAYGGTQNTVAEDGTIVPIADIPRVPRTRKPRAKAEVEDDADYLNEEDFTRLQDLKSVGVSSTDICIELGRSLKDVNKAWPYKTYKAYRGTDDLSGLMEGDEEEASEEAPEGVGDF